MTSSSGDLREIDRQVATEVMGLAPEDWPWKCFAENHMMDEGIFCYTCSATYDEGERVPPFYSSDPSAMMQVVERMREKGWEIAMSATEKQDTVAADEWWVDFTRGTEGHNAEGPTLPEAVARAALAACRASRESVVRDCSGSGNQEA